MNANSSAVKELRSSTDRIAQSAVARDYTRRPYLLARYGERGRLMYLQDTKFHMSYLADAISFGRLSIFRDYLEWLSQVLSRRGVAPEELTENLKCVREVMVEMLSKESLKAVLGVFDAGLADAIDAEGAAKGEESRQPLPEHELAKRYLDLLLYGQRQAALELVQASLRAGTWVREIWLRVFQDSQYEVGRLWQTNQISIAQEHYCTAATQMIMSRLYSYVMAGPRRGRVLLTACASGEIHELGMRMVADFFEIEGWDTCHLGANTPADGLVDFVAQRKPNLFGLSATMTFHLEAVATIIVALRGSPETRDVTIMVGGHAFNREPGLWREIGADCYARDAESALVVANSLPIGSLG